MKKCKCTPLSVLFTDRGKDLGILILRVFAGSMLLVHGCAKVTGFPELSATFPDPIGLGSKLSLILVILAEVGASVFIIAGALTRLAALVLMFSMSVAAFIVHAPFSVSGSELPLMYLGIFTFLFIAGAGRYSLDGLFRCKCRSGSDMAASDGVK